MKFALVLIILNAFILGVIGTVLYSQIADSRLETAFPIGENIPIQGPADRIQENEVHVFGNGILIDLKNAEWATFTATHSMDPVLSDTAHAIQIVPQSESEINVGDIISYKSDYADGTIIHRVQSINYDENGWYCMAKGDNNPTTDPGKIRFSQIKRVLVAIIY